MLEDDEVGRNRNAAVRAFNAITPEQAKQLLAGRPTAGNLLCQAVDRWAQHASSCQAEPCVTCDVAFNQVRVAWKVWDMSRHKAVSAEGWQPINTLPDHLDWFLAAWRCEGVDGETKYDVGEVERDGDGYFTICGRLAEPPTHWMPLPTAPASSPEIPNPNADPPPLGTTD